VERTEQFIPTGKAMGIDVGLNHFYTDSDGNTIANPRYLRKSEKAFLRLQKRISRKKKGSSNRKKAIRTHICGRGAVLDRDHNALLNILTGLKQAGITLNTVGHTEINAWGQTDLYSLVAAKQR
jgi:transposase